MPALRPLIVIIAKFIRIFGVLRQALGALASVCQRAERSIGRHDRVEPAIE
jgi:hypothetical protein